MASVMRFDEWQDSNGVSVASGAGGVFSAPGSILQVVSTAKTDTFSSTSSSYVSVTGLSATITPSSTSSKVMIFAQLNTGQTAVGGDRPHVRISGGNATNYVGAAAGSRTRASASGLGTNSSEMESLSIVYLDSPSTTSAVTYQVEILTAVATVYVNRTGADSDTNSLARTASSITVMEVAG